MTHPYHPFTGDNDLGDLIRILLVIASFMLIMWIGRVLIEGHRAHSMTRGQIARFLGLAILAGSLSLGSASRFGAPLNGYVIANLIGVAVSWYGVAAIRREQRNGQGSRP